jgi:hypothetical protein
MAGDDEVNAEAPSADFVKSVLRNHAGEGIMELGCDAVFNGASGAISRDDILRI